MADRNGRRRRTGTVIATGFGAAVASERLSEIAGELLDVAGAIRLAGELDDARRVERMSARYAAAATRTLRHGKPTPPSDKPLAFDMAHVVAKGEPAAPQAAPVDAEAAVRELAQAWNSGRPPSLTPPHATVWAEGEPPRHPAALGPSSADPLAHVMAIGVDHGSPLRIVVSADRAFNCYAIDIKEAWRGGAIPAPSLGDTWRLVSEMGLHFRTSGHEPKTNWLYMTHVDETTLPTELPFWLRRISGDAK